MSDPKLLITKASLHMAGASHRRTRSGFWGHRCLPPDRHAALGIGRIAEVGQSAHGEGGNPASLYGRNKIWVFLWGCKRIFNYRQCSGVVNEQDENCPESQ